MKTHDEQVISPVQDELKISIRPHGHPYCEYVGTRMQIEAEGIVPDAAKWQAGFCRSEWEANGIAYWLVRERPKGAKGPRAAFLECDNWCLRTMLPGPWPDERITIKAKELEQLLYRQTPDGRAEWKRNWKLYSAALDDKNFQAFKALIPALIPPSRKRRSAAGAG